VATQMPTAIQSINTTHIKNLKNPTMLSRSTMAKPMEDTVQATNHVHKLGHYPDNSMIKQFLHRLCENNQ